MSIPTWVFISLYHDALFEYAKKVGGKPYQNKVYVENLELVVPLTWDDASQYEKKMWEYIGN
jgi:hypothetical protein